MDKQLLEFLNPAFEQQSKQELDRLLDEELSKPEGKRDYNKIEEINAAYAALCGDIEETDHAVERGIQKLKQHKIPKVRATRRIRLMVTAGAVAILLLAANVFTVAAYQQNVFSVIIHYAKEGFSVQYTEHETIELPITPDDPYGIKAECAKYGLDVLAPTYLPEGFQLGDYNHNIAEGYCTSVDFWFYRDRKEVFSISYNLFFDPSNGTSIPSDHFNLYEIEADGNPAIISQEDGQYTVIFKDKNRVETVIYMNHLDYDECDRVVASLK